MKVGYYKDDMQVISAPSVAVAAEEYADGNHQIEDNSDTEFQLYVLDDEGRMFIVSMGTDFDPVYRVVGEEKI